MRSTRGAELALIAVLAGCRERPAETAATSREARAEFARCVFDDVSAEAPPARVEAATRLALRRARAEFVVRAGRCEDALRVGTSVPPCLAPLRARWVELLPVAQRAERDAIALDVAVRRVGEAWRVALSCP